MSGRRWLVVLVGLMGCDPKGTDDSGQDGESLAGTDADGDGFAADVILVVSCACISILSFSVIFLCLK